MSMACVAQRVMSILEGSMVSTSMVVRPIVTLLKVRDAVSMASI